MSHVFVPKKDLLVPWGFSNQAHVGFQQPLRSMCPPIFKGELWTANWNCPPIGPKICMRGWFTPTKTNMSPKKEPFHKEGALPAAIFQGTCWFSGGESLFETWKWDFQHPKSMKAEGQSGPMLQDSFYTKTEIAPPLPVSMGTHNLQF